MFGSFLDNIPEDKRKPLESTDEKYTVFVPTDGAFAKIPLPIQLQLQKDTEFLRTVINAN